MPAHNVPNWTSLAATEPDLVFRALVQFEFELNLGEQFRCYGSMELRPEPGVSWPCVTLPLIQCCVSARAFRSYCAAQPKRLNSFETWHCEAPNARGKTCCSALRRPRTSGARWKPSSSSNSSLKQEIC